MTRASAFALALIILLGLALRVYHLHNPILDHPGWRQGDDAAIARNFFELRNNIFYPQTDYDGPPPNYVELELQLVPYAAAQFYRAFGVHEIFARLLVVAFSLATIPLIYALAVELYCRRAGLAAAVLFAIAPGAVYYGRAVIPESVMLFFGCGALLFWWRWSDRHRVPDFALAVIFAALAVLAKPTNLLLFAPMLALSFWRMRQNGHKVRLGDLTIAQLQGRSGDLTIAQLQGPLLHHDWSPYALVILSLLPFIFYYSHVHRIAEWHWMSGITAKHVLPTLAAELTSPIRVLVGLQSTLALLKMLATTVLGAVLFALLLVAALTQPAETSSGARSVFFGAWIAALCIYAFVVVNVERVDYYLMPFVPFAVLYAGGALDHLVNLMNPHGLHTRTAVALAVAGFFTIYVNMLEIHPYYTWSRPVFAAATEVRATLEPGTLIVMGHYDPSVLYTIGHRGWEEDVLLWNVHDMTSAIAKGARYFVAIEVPRFRANKELYRFMQRYRAVPVQSGWQVYDLHHFAMKRPPRPRPLHVERSGLLSR